MRRERYEDMVTTQRINPVRRSAVAVLFLSICGCSTMPQAGFLGDYSGFRTVGQDAPFFRGLRKLRVGKHPLELEAWLADRQISKLSGYDRLIVEPAVVRLDVNSTANWARLEKIQELARHADDAIKAAVEGRLAIVDAAGEGVLRLRTAIVRMEPRSVPVESNIDRSWYHVHTGGATLEVEAVDSVTGERIFAAIASGSGSIYSESDETRWQNTRDILDAYAASIRQRLDEHPIQKKPSE